MVRTVRGVAWFSIAVFVLLAGCSGVGGGLEIAAQDADTTAFGNLEITVTVENTADDSQSGVLTCEAKVGGRVYEESAEVALAGGSSEVVELSIDVPLSDYGEDGTYSCDIEE